MDYKNVYLKLTDGKIVSTKIEKNSGHDGILNAKLSGINDRDAAFALRGAVVLVDRAEFPEPDEDEFYWVDLIGMNVINLQGEELGVVTDLMETGASDILVVKTSEVERLIHFVAQYIISVERATKIITADWGLDY